MGWIIVILILGFFSYVMPRFVRYGIVAPLIGTFLGGFLWGVTGILFSVSFISIVYFMIVGILVVEVFAWLLS
jgi:hypothetical protein